MKELIRSAIKEDIGTGDITSDNIIPEDKQAEAIITAKEEGIICGLDFAKEVFQELDPSVVFESDFSDGDPVKKRDDIVLIKGNARALLKSERIVLNTMSLLSGISTATRKYVDKVKEYGVKILDTRKTAPGFRKLMKHAVKAGGGKNHRMGLYDMVLIKDNHIKVAGGVKQAVEKVKGKVDVQIEIETENLEQVKEALETDVDWIMLDNMSLEDMKKAVEFINKRVKVEASGNVNIDNVEEIAKTGVDYISIGALTHSFKRLDLSMNIKL